MYIFSLIISIEEESICRHKELPKQYGIDVVVDASDAVHTTDDNRVAKAERATGRKTEQAAQ